MERFAWIDDYVIGLIDLYGTNDIHELYNYLDIKIIRVNKDNILLRGDSDAVYQRNFFDEEIVFIRNNLNYKYEKFVLAHELGHAILHIEVYNAAFNKRFLKHGKLEKQADYFAVKLLDIKIDPVEFENLTMEQIASSLCLPRRCLKSMEEFLEDGADIVAERITEYIIKND